MTNRLNIIQCSFFLIAIVFFSHCSDSSSVKSVPTDTKDETIVKEKTPEKEMLYAWVDKLNIRSAPNTKSDIVASAKKDEPMTFMGDQSDQKETIVLRGVAYNEPWLKIQTKDQEEGWVYGGAVNKKGESKGNALIDKNLFSFPYFGNYDLGKWKRLSSTDNNEGDAETTKSSYQNGNQVLEITKTDVGEYGYSRTYKLLDTKNNLLKLREFEFNTDPGFVLVEKVSDYTVSPAKKYSRSQKLEKHYVMLNAYPEMANGEWEETVIK